MKYALIDGIRQEAQSSVSGRCPVCDKEMIAKCGDIKVWHWAHKGRRTCDPWWENETEWHRTWKGQFPKEWQEFVNRDDSGEKHIADVKTDQGWVIEFQHSRIDPEERRVRDAFYPKLVWVVDGKARKRDAAQFQCAFDSGLPTAKGSRVRKVSSENSALLKEWSDCRAPVFFDFGGANLGCLLPKSAKGSMYVTGFRREQFIAIHTSPSTLKASGFEEFVMQFGKLVSDYESPPQPQPVQQNPRLQAQYFSPMVRRRRRL